MMKKLVLSLTLMAFLMPSAFAVAGSGGDGNRDSLRQAQAAVVAQQKKEDAAWKAVAEATKVALTSPKAKSQR